MSDDGSQNLCQTMILSWCVSGPGAIVFPGDADYVNAGRMKDSLFDSKFGAIVYPQTTGISIMDINATIIK